jgi:hypothetical protein
MKSLKKLSILLSLVSLFSCDETVTPNPNPNSTQVDTTKCSTCYQYNDVGANHAQLDYNLLQTMALNYQYTNGAAASPNRTRSIWLSLDELKNFIYQIESKTCGCDAKLGVRIYYGAYPDDNRWKNVFQNDLTGLRNSVMTKHHGSPTSTANNPYANINTLFMVPTIYTGGKNVDFEPKNFAGKCDAKGDPFSLTNIFGVVQKDSSNTFTNNAYGTPITALVAKNHGDACPPPVNGQSCKVEGAHFDY